MVMMIVMDGERKSGRCTFSATFPCNSVSAPGDLMPVPLLTRIVPVVVERSDRRVGPARQLLFGMDHSFGSDEEKLSNLVAL